MSIFKPKPKPPKDEPVRRQCIDCLAWEDDNGNVNHHITCRSRRK